MADSLDNQDIQWDHQLHALGKKFVTELFMMLKTASLYDPNNTAFVNALTSFETSLKDLIGRFGSLSIEIIEDNLFLNSEKMKSDIYTHSIFSFVNDELTQKELGGIQFESQPSKDELKKFTVTFSRFKDTDKNNFEVLNEALKKQGINHILVLEKRKKSLSSVDEDTVSTNKAKAIKNYIRAVEVVKNAVTRFDSGKSFDARKAKRIVYNLVQHSADEGYSFVGLSTIKNYDAYTFHHCVNVCIISITFGQNLGLSKRQLADLGIGALYHDMGELNIPKDILNKPGQFTEEEWGIMKQHPVLAMKHLLPLDSPTDMDIKKVVPAFEHHRDYDLTGYPPQTIRKPLNFYSKVVAIADAYDALTSSRVYQQGRLPSEALQIILRAAGKKFDPVLVKAFINTMGIYPVGSMVQLNNNFLGVVCEVNKDPTKGERPKVSVMMDKDGNLRKEKTVDLAEPQFKDVHIVKAVDPEMFKVNVSYYLLGA